MVAPTAIAALRYRLLTGSSFCNPVIGAAGEEGGRNQGPVAGLSHHLPTCRGLDLSSIPTARMVRGDRAVGSANHEKRLTPRAFRRSRPPTRVGVATRGG